jgi:hypothetical protein
MVAAAVAVVLLATVAPASAQASPVAGEGARPATIATCPKAPARPASSSAYALEGQVWDSADPVGWTLDTAGLTPAGITSRRHDITRALADASRETNFDFVYKGLVDTIAARPPLYRLQFSYTPAITGTYAGSLGDQSTLYIPGRRNQTVDGNITLLSSLGWGYGAYDAAHPAHSPEGDVLLHEIGAVLGLGTVAVTPPEVMSDLAGVHDYFAGYQAGDEMGLWKVGASLGCKGFPT